MKRREDEHEGRKGIKDKCREVAAKPCNIRGGKVRVGVGQREGEGRGRQRERCGGTRPVMAVRRSK